ncbi:MAG: iron uptake porin [Coleofasciculaceae cyanobacterium]
MKNLQQLIYSSFLITAVLAVPVAAQTVNTETNAAATNTSSNSNELDKATIVPLFTRKESAKSVSPTVLPQSAFEPKETQLPQVFKGQKVADTPQPQTAATPTSTDTAQTLPSANPNALESETAAMEQVTNVTQLRDVAPSDWAYEALRSLVERYGCIAGYPDGTFRGNRAMSRFEFAAGLNACLAQVERLIASNSGGFVTKEDLARIQRLRDEFATEIATIAGRVDKLETRTTTLEGRQFSTTTKLFGQAVVGLQGRTENQGAIFGVKVPDPDTNINVISNVQLSLLTQFSPRSLLLTGLQAGSGRTSSFNPNSLNPTFKRLGYEGDTNNSLFLSDLTYRQLIGNNFAFIVGPAGVNAVNVFRGANRVESAGFGPISAFAQRNPIINIGAGSTGVGFDWQIVPRISLQAVYSTDSASDPGNGGIFGGRTGRTAAGVQLAFAPIDTVDVALNYINSYSPSSTFGLLGTGIGDDQITVNAPLKTNAFGGTVSWRVSPRFTVGGWFGYTDSKSPGRSGSAETINWMGFLNFPDLLGRGNLAGIYVGQPPKITSSNFPVGFNIPSLLTDGNGDPGGQPGTATHVEAFYRLRLTDNISITPGVVVVFNPGHNSASDTVTIGAVRTTFTF